jgi:hypothetical protein
MAHVWHQGFLVDRTSAHQNDRLLTAELKVVVVWTSL